MCQSHAPPDTRKIRCISVPADGQRCVSHCNEKPSIAKIIRSRLSGFLLDRLDGRKSWLWFQFADSDAWHFFFVFLFLFPPFDHLFVLFVNRLFLLICFFLLLLFLLPFLLLLLLLGLSGYCVVASVARQSEPAVSTFCRPAIKQRNRRIAWNRCDRLTSVFHAHSNRQ